MHCVNGLNEARAVLAQESRQLTVVSREVVPSTTHLMSPPFAACHAGVGYYTALVAALREEFPHVPFEFYVCCGDDAAIAMEALRLGLRHLRCTAPEPMLATLRMAGAVLLKSHPLGERGCTL